VLSNGDNGVSMSITGVYRTWHISKTNPNAGSGITLQFNWQASDIVGSLTNPIVMHYNALAAGGPKWEKYRDNITRGENKLTLSGYMDAFSPFIIVEDNTVLPLTWGVVSVNRSGAAALVKWTAYTEENEGMYHVQHSTDGKEWNTIGSLVPSGNFLSPSQYQFLHAQPANGINYYRIIEQDKDGSQYIGKTVSLILGSTTGFRIYPNPVAGGVLNIDHPNAEILKIFDNNGTLVKSAQVKAGHNIIDLSALPKGIYLVKSVKETITLIIP